MANFEQSDCLLPEFEPQAAPREVLRLVPSRGVERALPTLFHLHAYIDSHVLEATAKTAKAAFAKAIEWHVVDRRRDQQWQKSLFDHGVCVGYGSRLVTGPLGSYRLTSLTETKIEFLQAYVAKDNSPMVMDGQIDRVSGETRIIVRREDQPQGISVFYALNCQPARRAF